MNESILDDIKKELGFDPCYTAFDRDIIMHINSVFMTLKQLGVGPKAAFQINGAGQTWVDFDSSIQDINAVKTYIYLKVKMVFDPSASPTITEAYSKQASEYEWRLIHEKEYEKEGDES